MVEVSYNVQAAVDAKHKLLVATHTINRNDRNALSAIAIETKQNLDVATYTAILDKGYHNGREIQKCKDMRSRLIPFQMRLEQMQLHQSHTYHEYAQSSKFQFKVGILECGISNELRLIEDEEKVLFDMHQKHHCIKKSITDIIEKTKTSSSFSKLYTRVQAKNYVDDVYKMVTV